MAYEYFGRQLKGMVAAATRCLEKTAPQIDALNVFPVPDGDTGTNMLLTMRALLEELEGCPDDHVGEISQAMARGALMGARGNSGVILSQVWRGLAAALSGKETFTPGDFVRGLREGAVLAYKGVSRPVEGTMLTVIREVSEALSRDEAEELDLLPLLEKAVAVAAASVGRTPSLLPVLKQAGVVDAGGQGFYVILEGFLYYLKGEDVETAVPRIISPAIPVQRIPAGMEESGYGYCTEFLLRGQGLNVEKIRRQLEKAGDSVMVVGDSNTVKVHLHTPDPGKVLHRALGWGSLHDILIRNMDDQYKDFQEKAVPSPRKLAVVAVVSGEGFARVFRSLGAAVIVPGGATMNPSTKEILRGIEAAPSDRVLLLPNNGNVLAAAEQAAGMSSKRVTVLPSRNMPQGVAALLAFNPEADDEANIEAMERACSQVRVLEVTRAVRPARWGRLRIRRGQVIGLLDGELVAARKDVPGLVAEVLPRLLPAEVVTIYYGDGVSEGEARNLSRLFVENDVPEVEVVYGGQPNYGYVISVE